MKKRMALIAGGVALTAAAAIPAANAFACPPISPHCQKVLGGINTASNILNNTNSNSSTAQPGLQSAFLAYGSQKCF